MGVGLAVVAAVTVVAAEMRRPYRSNLQLLAGGDRAMITTKEHSSLSDESSSGPRRGDVMGPLHGNDWLIDALSKGLPANWSKCILLPKKATLTKIQAQPTANHFCGSCC